MSLWLPSVFSVLRPGIGPSSSHTLGPILAARDFRQLLTERAGSLPPAGRLQAVLQGSLALTGRGHLTDQAVVAGLDDFDPKGDAKETLAARCRTVRQAGGVRIAGRFWDFEPERDLRLDTVTAGLAHPNTLLLRLLGPDGTPLLEQTYLSVGGGEVRAPGRPGQASMASGQQRPEGVSRPTMSAVVDECLRDGKDLAQLALENEAEHHGLPREEVLGRLSGFWERMGACIERGLHAEGMLPGRLQLERRAAEMFASLQRSLRQWRVLSLETTLAATYAIAVAEENAAGGWIVTAPTCGSAGIVPSALKVLQERFRLDESRMREGLLVGGLVGGLVAHNASIAGAEVGCQGEVGTASAMAAAAVCHLLEGTVPQVEAAAEMALEHHLGLTCDPVFGLVQIPCIERNAVGAVTALNAANVALLSSGKHVVSFDAAVDTLHAVGTDMPCQYKETALGGLATRLPRR